MDKIVLDLTGCKYVRQIHRVIKETFDFPDFYGGNFDAMWDCMRDYCEDMDVSIKGLSTLPKEFDDFSKTMLEIFEMVSKENNFTFSVIS